MPKVKIPRKSTAVDMTAMCDVAFLLLSFFSSVKCYRSMILYNIHNYGDHSPYKWGTIIIYY